MTPESLYTGLQHWLTFDVEIEQFTLFDLRLNVDPDLSQWCQFKTHERKLWKLKTSQKRIWVKWPKHIKATSETYMRFWKERIVRDWFCCHSRLNSCRASCCTLQPNMSKLAWFWIFAVGHHSTENRFLSLKSLRASLGIKKQSNKVPPCPFT